MATIYRFVIEQKTTGGSGGSGRNARSQTGKGAAKKGKMVSLFAGERGGVEHNRKMRAINPLLNRLTHGYWEKGMRLGRAGLGLVQRNTETGKLGLSGPAVAIIIAMVIQTMMKFQQHEINLANKRNMQNFKQLENGVSSIHTQYTISRDFWTGARTFNENK